MTIARILNHRAKPALGLAAVLLAGAAFETRADVSVTLKRERHEAKNEKPVPIGATGSQALIDASGFQYFINTDITFSTSSSASGAASEASYTGPVAADTAGGGVSTATLNDAFDGYGSLCVSTDGGLGPCESEGGGKAQGVATYTMYNQNGAATTECGGRQVVFNPQTIGSLTVSRKVYVPADDEFIRFLSVVTNNGGAAVSVNLVSGNNLGSDSTTAITATDNGNATAEAADRWVASFQNFSGNTSSDPRLAHVFFGNGGAVGLANLSFQDGDDNPFWAYTLTLQPGETRAIAVFATGQESRAAAAAKGAELAAYPAAAQACLNETELTQVANFLGVPEGPQTPVVEVPTVTEVGLLALALLLAGSGLLLFRR